MVGLCADTVGAEAGGERFAIFSEERVDDAWNVVGALILTGELRQSVRIRGTSCVRSPEPGEEVVVVISGV